MAVKGELEGLIANHNLLISRGSIVEAAKVKALIAGYLSQKDMLPRLYRAVRDKFEEFLHCAESNFPRFQEIINYQHLTQLEFLYPEYFEEFTRETNDSKNRMIAAGNYLYAGLIAASSLHSERKKLEETILHFLKKENYNDIEKIFARLEETRRLKVSLSPQNGQVREFPLISDEEVAQRIGRALFEAYTIESEKLEQVAGSFSASKAYKLASLLTTYLPEQLLITDGSMTSTATMYFKELIGKTDLDNTADLVEFMERFKKNLAIMRYASENPQVFESYMNSQEIRDGLNELMRNMLGKTRFDEVRVLASSLEGIVPFGYLFKEHIGTLKEQGFFVLAIEMAEKLHMREELTDDLKLEAFRKLLDELANNPVPQVLNRVIKFCAMHRINSENYPQIVEDASKYLDELEKANPEIENDLQRLYRQLRIEKQNLTAGASFNPGRLFEPVIWFFTLIFRVFVRLLGIFLSRGADTESRSGRKNQKVTVK
ncbi:MAG: hypothetical protein V1794_10505 [Candidatus Glassbacteria bacterium]